MLELINQLDGFDPRGNIKVLMATNRLGEELRVNPGVGWDGVGWGGGVCSSVVVSVLYRIIGQIPLIQP